MRIEHNAETGAVKLMDVGEPGVSIGDRLDVPLPRPNGVGADIATVEIIQPFTLGFGGERCHGALARVVPAEG